MSCFSVPLSVEPAGGKRRSREEFQPLMTTTSDLSLNGLISDLSLNGLILRFGDQASVDHRSGCNGCIGWNAPQMTG
jgi:hypothetical protein